MMLRVPAKLFQSEKCFLESNPQGLIIIQRLSKALNAKPAQALSSATPVTHIEALKKLLYFEFRIT